MSKKVKCVILSILLLLCLGGIFLEIRLLVPKYIKNDNKIQENNNNKVNDNEQSNNTEDNNQSKDNIVEVSLDDSKVSELVKKIDFDNIVLANLYKNGDFDKNTIPNDLILKIGFNTELNWKKDGELYDETSNPNFYGDYRWLIPKELLENNIKYILGNIEYKHDSLIVTDLSPDFGSIGINGSGKFENNKYEIGLRFGRYPKYMINQIPYKAEYINNEIINIYFKTFYSTSGCQLGDDINVYKSYDFNNGKLNDDYMFMQGVTEASLACLKERNIDITGIETFEEYINKIEPSKLKDYGFFDKLDSYVYTFELSDDGNYYLSSFKKVI